MKRLIFILFISCISAFPGLTAAEKEFEGEILGQKVNYKKGEFEIEGNNGDFCYELVCDEKGNIRGKLNGLGQTVGWDGTSVTASGEKGALSYNTKTGEGGIQAAGQNLSFGKDGFSAGGQAGPAAYDIAYSKEGGIAGKVDAGNNTVSWDGSKGGISGEGFDVSYDKGTGSLNANVQGQELSYQKGNFSASGTAGGAAYDIAYSKEGGITGKVDAGNNTVSWDGSKGGISGEGFDVSYDKGTGSLNANVQGQELSYQKGNFSASGTAGGAAYDIAYSKSGGITGKIDANGNRISYDGSVAKIQGDGYKVSFDNASKAVSGKVMGQSFSFKPGNFKASGNAGGCGYGIAYNGKSITGKLDYQGNVMTYDGKTIKASGQDYSYSCNPGKGSFDAGGNAGGVGYGLKTDGKTVSGKLDYQGNTVSFSKSGIAASGKVAGSGSYSASWDGKGITAGASYGGFKASFQNGKFSWEGPKLVSAAGNLLGSIPQMSEYSISPSFLKSFFGKKNKAQETESISSLDEVIDKVFEEGR